jgi:hypothetical protein
MINLTRQGLLVAPQTPRLGAPLVLRHGLSPKGEPVPVPRLQTGLVQNDDWSVQLGGPGCVI